MKIYFPSIGSRHTINEHKTITWYLDQQTKNMPNGTRLAFFLNFKMLYEKILIETQSFELMAYITRKIRILEYFASNDKIKNK